MRRAISKLRMGHKNVDLVTLNQVFYFGYFGLDDEGRWAINSKLQELVARGLVARHSHSSKWYYQITEAGDIKLAMLGWPR